MGDPRDQTDDDAGPIDPLLLRPLYSLGGTSAILRVPPATVHAWSQQRSYRTADGSSRASDPVMTTVEPVDGLSVPFLGLTEAYVLASFSAAGLPIPLLRPELPRLAHELPSIHPLASELLVTRGPQVMATDPVFAPLLDDDGERPRFREPVAQALGRIVHHDGWPTAIVLAETGPTVVLDPRLNTGRPTVAGTQVGVNEVITRLASGETAEAVARRTGLELEDVHGLRD